MSGIPGEVEVQPVKAKARSSVSFQSIVKDTSTYSRKAVSGSERKRGKRSKRPYLDK